MSNESLSSLVLDVLDNNRKVGKSIVGAYREGGTRLVSRRLFLALGSRGERIDDLLVAGVGKASDGADYALDTFYDRASRVVTKVASTVDTLGDRYSPVSLNFVRNAVLPGARIARRLSTRLAARCGRFYTADAAKTVGKSAKKAARKTAKSVRKAA
jgi:hypothetical protein